MLKASARPLHHPHPKDMREDVMEAMAQTESVCEHLHFLSNPVAIEYSKICTEDIQRAVSLETVAGKSDYS